ncbi:hypothetical protein NKG94_31610 [Micromonospora sp. M12]
MSDDCEREVFARVLDALLREDHGDLLSTGSPDGPDWWQVPHPAGLLRIPVRADGFQQALRSATPMVLVVGPGETRRTETVEGLLTLLAPHGNAEAEAGWRDFGAECRADLRARRLAARTRPRVLAEVAADRALTPTGLPAALLDDVLAAHQGHPVYPTDRCRHGLTDDELLRYARNTRHASRCGGTRPRRGRPAHRRTPVLVAARTATGPPVAAGASDHRGTRRAAGDGPAGDPGAAHSRCGRWRSTSTRTCISAAAADREPRARNRRTLQPGSLADGAAVAALLDRIATAEPAFAGRIRHADESTWGTSATMSGVASCCDDFPRPGRRPRGAGRGLAAVDPTAGTVLQRISPRRPIALLESYLDLLLDWHVFLWLRQGSPWRRTRRTSTCWCTRTALSACSTRTTTAPGSTGDTGPGGSP